MPHIDIAMRRSVQKGVADIVFDSLLSRRGITDDVSSVQTTFSSWDNCMAASYCKYPVIAGLIIGGLIIFSVLWCIIRCACCGMSCCCTCFSFLKCCDCCGGCCDGKKNKPAKYKDNYDQSNNRGYQAPAPMMGGALATPSYNSAPQFATFETGPSGFAIDKPAVNEDALPPMPSWDTASKKHIPADEKNGVELGELDPATGQQIPLMAGGAGTGMSAPASPLVGPGHSPYGQPSGYSDQYGHNQNNYNQAPGAYGRGTPVAEPGRSYTPSNAGSRGYASSQLNAQQGYGNSDHSGGQGYAQSPNGSGRGYGPPSPQDPYGGNNNFAAAGYERQGSVSGSNGRGQGYPSQPTRQFSGDRPGAERQYTDQSYRSDNYQQAAPVRGPSRGPTPQQNNNSGFDFGTQNQYSRPAPQRQQTYDSYQSNTTAPPTYASRSPPPQEQPYRAYGQAPQTLMPGGGRSREPQNWDPVQR